MKTSSLIAGGSAPSDVGSVQSGQGVAGLPSIIRAVQFIFSLFGSSINETADGVLVLLNNAGTGFTRLCFGGTTAAFPSLKRNAAVIDVVAADNSVLLPMRVSNSILTGAAVADGANTVIGSTSAATVGAAGAAAALPATPVGYLIINVAGTQMKIPYYNT